MALRFSPVGAATEELKIWSASERGFSFVIIYESRSGPGLHGQPGFVASAPHPYQQVRHQGERITL